jgi:hypothetical protein
MDFLLKDNYTVEFNENNDLTEITIKILSNNKIFKGVLPKKIVISKYNKSYLSKTFKFDKYDLSKILKKYIEESNVLCVKYSDYDLLDLYMDNIELEKNKIHKETIIIDLYRVFMLDYDKVDNLEDMIKLTKDSIEYIQYLKNKLEKLENKINELENKVENNVEKLENKINELENKINELNIN